MINYQYPTLFAAPVVVFSASRFEFLGLGSISDPENSWPAHPVVYSSHSDSSINGDLRKVNCGKAEVILVLSRCGMRKFQPPQMFSLWGNFFNISIIITFGGKYLYLEIILHWQFSSCDVDVAGLLARRELNFENVGVSAGHCFGRVK